MKALHHIAAMLGASSLPCYHCAPSRPSLPPLLALGLSLWGCSALIWPMCMDLLPQQLYLALLIGVGIGLTCVFLLCLKKKWVLLASIVAGFALALATCASSSLVLLSASNTAESQGVFDAQLVALEDARINDYGNQALCSIGLPDGRRITALCYFEGDGNRVLYGERIVAQVDLASPSAASRDRAWLQGQAATAQVSKMRPQSQEGVEGWLLNLREGALDAFGSKSEASCVLQALVCGYTAEFDDTQASENFKVCGLSHIIAVSGAHLVIVSCIATVLLQTMRVPRAIAVGAQVMLMAGYLVLTGMPVSAQRAFVMALISQTAFFAKRRAAGLSALGLCIAVMVALDPKVALSASFALSALATLGISLFNPLMSFWLGRVVPFLPGWACEALALTTSSSLLVQPYACALFSQLPLVSPFANVLCAPLLAPVCGLGIACGLACSATGFTLEALITVPLLGAQGLCSIAQLCSGLPFACIPVTLSEGTALLLSVLLAIALWAVWPTDLRRGVIRKTIKAATVLMALLVVVHLASLQAKENTLVMLDVGQGDSFLMRSQGATLLVDTGAYDSLLRKALARQGVVALDAVVITHADNDHCGALASLKGVVSVNKVVVAADALDCPCEACTSLRLDALTLVGEEGLVGVELHDVVKAGAFDLQVVWPRMFADEGGNADSLCLLARVDSDGDKSFEWEGLMVGDAEGEQLDEIIEANHLQKIDFLKVGHHGSRAAFEKQHIDSLDPTLSLISVGANNRYGHPSQEVMDILSECGSTVYRTDLQGDVCCKFHSNRIEVTTMR